jgi:large subunit ribosomal protein L19
MSHKLIEAAEAACRKSKMPSFRIGDTVTVSVRIVEGDKERLQPYIGVVIGRRGTGLSEMFTVRRIVNNEGVERVFPIHSPSVAGVKVVRTGKVARAKLYYLRERVGKKRRLRERKAGGEGEGMPESRGDAKTAEPVGAA